MAFSLADTAADATNGTGSFAGTPQPIHALARLYPNFSQVVVRADADVTTLADLRGKRVSTGSPKSGTEVIANRMLQAAGLNPETDLAAQRLDIGASVDGMKDGTIDAMFFSGGLPTPNLTEPVHQPRCQSAVAGHVCVLTKTLFDRKTDLVAINPAADNITLQRARDTAPVPLHPGAKQALDTLGAP